MNVLTLPLLALAMTLWDRVSRADGERGDVPGWVMVTIMSAGLVVAILVAAKGPITNAVTDAINSVTSESGAKTGP